MANIEFLCRICLNEGKIAIFNSKSSHSISERIMACAPVQVSIDDGYPPKICKNCLSELNTAYEFQQRCVKSDKEFRKWIADYTEDSSGDDEDSQCAGSEVNLIHRKDDDYVYEEIYLEKESRMPCAKDEVIDLENGETLKRKEDKIKIILVKKRSDIVPSTQSKHKSDTSSAPKSTSKKIHMCKACGKIFNHETNLNQHERIHSGDKPYGCETCGRRFTQSAHLLVHYRTHTGTKPYKCHICGRCFTVSQSLNKHIRTHTGERPYKCEVCDKAFAHSAHLQYHKTRHLNNNLPCDWPGCGYKLANASLLKAHRKTHAKNN